LSDETGYSCYKNIHKSPQLIDSSPFEWWKF